MLTLRRRRQQGQFAPHHHRIPPARRWLPAAIAVLLLAAAPVADAFSFRSEDTCGELCTDAFWGGGKVTVEAVARLLDEGVDVNAHDDSTSTPLHYAAAHASDPAIVQFLLARGAQVDAQNAGGQGSTPLEWAAAHDNPATATALLDAGAQLNRPHSPICCLDKGWRALHMAAASASAEMVELLISRGADVNAGGYDPIHAAARTNPDPRVLEALVKAGANINARARGTDYAGWTPLFFAVTMNNSAVVRKLLSYRAIDVNAKDWEEKRLGYGGDTALHAAIKGGRTTAARILLNDERVDIRIKNVAGETPEDLICDVARFSADIKPGWCEQ